MLICDGGRRGRGCRKIQIRIIFQKINISTVSCQIFGKFHPNSPKIFTIKLKNKFKIGGPRLSQGSVFWVTLKKIKSCVEGFLELLSEI